MHMEASTQPSLTLLLRDVAAQHNRRKIQRIILPLMSHSLALIEVSGPRPSSSSSLAAFSGSGRRRLVGYSRWRPRVEDVNIACGFWKKNKPQNCTTESLLAQIDEYDVNWPWKDGRNAQGVNLHCPLCDVDPAKRAGGCT
jgi:hypothetical protein